MEEELSGEDESKTRIPSWAVETAMVSRTTIGASILDLYADWLAAGLAAPTDSLDFYLDLELELAELSRCEHSSSVCCLRYLSCAGRAAHKEKALQKKRSDKK